jgi:DnaJ-domain-containing protein 1
VHRAPRSADALEDYLWFCLEHIREYNARWDYFKGRSMDEMEAYREAAMTGHRPTWPMSHAPGGPDWHVRDPIDILKVRPGMGNPFESAAMAKNRAALTPKLRRALDRLGLDETASVAEIKTRYKSLVKKYHPDSAGGPGSEDRLKQIIQAYSDLKASGRLAADAV